MKNLLKQVSLAAAFIVLSFSAGVSKASMTETIKLKGDERIVFAGDSITAFALSKHGFITLLEKQLSTQFTPHQFKFFDAGIPGNTSLDLMKRYEHDVLSKKPNLVVLYIGINDANMSRLDPESQNQTVVEYKHRLEYMVLETKKRHSAILLCTPSVIGEKAQGENDRDALLDQLADQARAVATECNVPICDLRKGFQNFLKTENPLNWKEGITTADGVHLNDVGNRLVAQMILLSFGLVPH